MPEFPHELIRQLQICSRAAAGLPAYNPEGPTLAALPSLAATIASADPSQPDLRCENCKGKLLRGIRSNICVYCGRRRQNDVVPEPICFEFTTGYQWILRSLGLDGSEMVKPPTNFKTKREQGKRSPSAETQLSDFLKIRVTWASETNKEDASISDQRAEESTRSLSLTGFAPDDFFFKFKKDAFSSTSSEQLILHNQISHDNPDLFQTFHSSDLAGISLKDESTKESSEWEADFQFADSANLHGVTSSYDHFMGASADSANKFQDSESFNRSTGFSDLNSDEQGNVVSSSESQLIEGLNNIAGSKDDHKLDSANDLSISVDFFGDFKWQTDNTHATENMMVGQGNKTISDDSFNDWDDFIGSSSAQDPSGNVWSGSQTNDTHVTESTMKGKEYKAINDDTFSEWNDFTASSSLQDSSQIVSYSESQFIEGLNNIDGSKDYDKLDSANDLSDDFKWQTDNTYATENMTVGQGNKTISDDSFNEWDDFIGSSSAQDPSRNVWSGSQTNDTYVTESTMKGKEHKAINNDTFQ